MTQRFVRISVVAMVGLVTTVSLTQRVPLGHAAEKATATAQTVDQKKDVKKEARYIGSKESKRYHKPSCEWVKKIGKGNRVEFASAADATKAGYVPCKVCLATKETSKTDTKSHTTSKPRSTSTPSAKTGQ